jgi:RNA polymerase sigma-70 factor (ECF subfamily)
MMETGFKQSRVSTDAEIIQKILNGEGPLFEILIRRYNSVLYKIARSYGFNHQDAQDLMQEAHLAAYMQLKKFEHRSLYKTWLSKIIINKCLYKMRYGYFKNEHPASSLIDETAQPMLTQVSQSENEVTKRELGKVIEHSLQLLPVTYRTVFILREVEGFNIAETSELLQISPVNVKVRLNRAKAMLQKELEQVYSSAELYEFNLVYCDKIVKEVFNKINTLTI